MATPQNVLVVGAGLIGTSIAMGLTSAGFNVFIDDANADALNTARDKSGAKVLPTDSNIDVVVVATPPQTVAQIIRELLNKYPQAVITDVASVKGSIFASLADLASEQLARIVGGHPMAGREVSGAAAAQANLFVDRPWVIIRNDDTSDSARDAVRTLATQLGAIPLERTVLEHDQAVALVSHTPQVVASVLASRLVDAPDSFVQLAGQGLRDATRIAASNAQLWTEILEGNAQHVAEYVDAVASDLHDIANALHQADTGAINKMLVQGALGRERLPGKHGMNTPATSTVEVRLEDKPGELARLFAVAASVDVNLEDVRIDHSLGRMTGLVELTVAETSVRTLENALSAQGFIVVS